MGLNELGKREEKRMRLESKLEYDDFCLGVDVWYISEKGGRPGLGNWVG